MTLHYVVLLLLKPDIRHTSVALSAASKISIIDDERETPPKSDKRKHIRRVEHVLS